MVISPILDESDKKALVEKLRATTPSYQLPYVFMSHAGEMVVCRVPTSDEARRFMEQPGMQAGGLTLFKATVVYPEGELLRRLLRAKPLLGVTFGTDLARKPNVTETISPPLEGQALEALLGRLRSSPEDVLYVLTSDGEQAICRAPTEGEVLHWASRTEGHAVRAEAMFEKCALHPDVATREKLRLYKPFIPMGLGIELLRQAGLDLEAANLESRRS